MGSQYDDCSTDEDRPVGADEALARLMTGNARFLRGESRNTKTPMEVLTDLQKASGHLRPFSGAATRGCRRSCFSIRDSAICSSFAWPAMSYRLFMGSLGYAGEHFKTHLFMVLGHEPSGGGQGALSAKFLFSARLKKKICLFQELFTPGLKGGVRSFRRSSSLHAPWKPMSAGPCTSSSTRPKARERMAEGSVNLVGAVCDIATGRVQA